MLTGGKKLYEEAERHRREGDEELAYIFYMRYFNLLDSICKKPDYLAMKQNVRDMLGGNSAQKLSMDKLEVISKSLKRRYELLTQAKSLPSSTKLATYSAEQLERLKSSSTIQAAASKRLSPPAMADMLQDMNSITCAELYEKIRENSVLVMDCRSAEDYVQSRLVYPNAFNVPAELIVDG